MSGLIWVQTVCNLPADAASRQRVKSIFAFYFTDAPILYERHQEMQRNDSIQQSEMGQIKLKPGL